MVHVNMKALREKIQNSGLTIGNLADQMNIDRATIYRKLQQNGETFTIGQIHKMSEILALTSDEAKSIFLS